LKNFGKIKKGFFMLKENKEPTMDVVVEIMKIQKVTPV